MNLYNERYFNAPHNMPNAFKGVGITIIEDRNPTSRSNHPRDQVLPGLNQSMVKLTTGMRDQYQALEERTPFTRHLLPENQLGFHQMENTMYRPFLSKDSMLHKQGPRLVVAGNNFYYPPTDLFKFPTMENLLSSIEEEMHQLMLEYINGIDDPARKKAELSKYTLKGYQKNMPGFRTFLSRYYMENALPGDPQEETGNPLHGGAPAVPPIPANNPPRPPPLTGRPTPAAPAPGYPPGGYPPGGGPPGGGPPGSGGPPGGGWRGPGGGGTPGGGGPPGGGGGGASSAQGNAIPSNRITNITFPNGRQVQNVPAGPPNVGPAVNLAGTGVTVIPPKHKPTYQYKELPKDRRSLNTKAARLNARFEAAIARQNQLKQSTAPTGTKTPSSRDEYKNTNVYEVLDVDEDILPIDNEQGDEPFYQNRKQRRRGIYSGKATGSTGQLVRDSFAKGRLTKLKQGFRTPTATEKSPDIYSQLQDMQSPGDNRRITVETAVKRRKESGGSSASWLSRVSDLDFGDPFAAVTPTVSPDGSAISPYSTALSAKSVRFNTSSDLFIDYGVDTQGQHESWQSQSITTGRRKFRIEDTPESVKSTVRNNTPATPYVSVDQRTGEADYRQNLDHSLIAAEGITNVDEIVENPNLNDGNGVDANDLFEVGDGIFLDPENAADFIQQRQDEIEVLQKNTFRKALYEDYELDTLFNESVERGGLNSTQNPFTNQFVIMSRARHTMNEYGHMLRVVEDGDYEGVGVLRQDDIRPPLMNPGSGTLQKLKYNPLTHEDAELDNAISKEETEYYSLMVDDASTSIQDAANKYYKASKINPTSKAYTNVYTEDRDYVIRRDPVMGNDDYMNPKTTEPFHPFRQDKRAGIENRAAFKQLSPAIQLRDLDRTLVKLNLKLRDLDPQTDAVEAAATQQEVIRIMNHQHLIIHNHPETVKPRRFYYPGFIPTELQNTYELQSITSYNHLFQAYLDNKELSDVCHEKNMTVKQKLGVCMFLHDLEIGSQLRLAYLGPEAEKHPTEQTMTELFEKMKLQYATKSTKMESSVAVVISEKYGVKPATLEHVVTTLTDNNATPFNSYTTHVSGMLVRSLSIPSRKKEYIDTLRFIDRNGKEIRSIDDTQDIIRGGRGRKSAKRPRHILGEL